MLGDPVVERLNAEFQKILIKYYHAKYPEARVLSHDAVLTRMDKSRNFLRSEVFSYKFIKLNGRRVVPSEDVYYAPNGIVQTRWNGSVRVGQVVAIFKHNQNLIPHSPILLRVRWFRPLPVSFGVWDSL